MTALLPLTHFFLVQRAYWHAKDCQKEAVDSIYRQINLSADEMFIVVIYCVSSERRLDNTFCMIYLLLCGRRHIFPSNRWRGIHFDCLSGCVINEMFYLVNRAEKNNQNSFCRSQQGNETEIVGLRENGNQTWLLS